MQQTLATTDTALRHWIVLRQATESRSSERAARATQDPRGMPPRAFAQMADDARSDSVMFSASFSSNASFEGLDLSRTRAAALGAEARHWEACRSACKSQLQSEWRRLALADSVWSGALRRNLMNRQRDDGQSLALLEGQVRSMLWRIRVFLVWLFLSGTFAGMLVAVRLQLELERGREALGFRRTSTGVASRIRKRNHAPGPSSSVPSPSGAPVAAPRRPSGESHTGASGVPVTVADAAPLLRRIRSMRSEEPRGNS